MACDNGFLVAESVNVNLIEFAFIEIIIIVYIMIIDFNIISIVIIYAVTIIDVLTIQIRSESVICEVKL